ncbi:MAG: hypothetical protein IPF99_16960 [Deltaproteobacteria bacterium]|nr:hypothetical protein [Deltaproteobacteria bacterium]
MSTNGTSTNGTSTNGTSTNGTSTNGTSTNGTSTNGTSTNGTSTNGASAATASTTPVFAASVPTLPTSLVAQAPSKEAAVMASVVILRTVVRIENSVADVGLQTNFGRPHRTGG